MYTKNILPGHYETTVDIQAKLRVSNIYPAVFAVQFLSHATLNILQINLFENLSADGRPHQFSDRLSLTKNAGSGISQSVSSELVHS